MDPVDPMEVVAGTPIADALARGLQALEDGEVDVGDAAFQRAVELSAGDARLSSALAIDHVARLLNRGLPTRALERCTKYLAHPGTASRHLQVLYAEIHSGIGEHSRADTLAAEARAVVGDMTDVLDAGEDARLDRVHGLAADDRGDHAAATRYLNAARGTFRAAGDEIGVQAVGRDMNRLAVKHGDEAAASKVLSGGAPRTVPDHLLHAQAFKLLLRYEEALHVLEPLTQEGLDPALRLAVLSEVIVLLRLTRQYNAASQLMPALQAAAAGSPDPSASAATVRRLFDRWEPDGPVPLQYSRAVRRGRQLIIDGRLDEAERLLGEIYPRRWSDSDVATWHLAAGELQLARNERAPDSALLTDAARHLGLAADRASATGWLAEVRVHALRLLGRVLYALNEGDGAAVCWAEAHHLEEYIAAHQVTDRLRIHMLQAVADEHDERIASAVNALVSRGAEATAEIVIAMEAARGATILKSTHADGSPPVRDLPTPGRFPDALRWVTDFADALPRTQAVWLIHPAHDQVHHALLGRRLIQYVSVPTKLTDLADAIDALAMCWAKPTVLEASISGGEFREYLDEVEVLVDVAKVLAALPRNIRRIVVVAGGPLSDVPFAAMTATGTGQPLGLRYALSDLPCLSVKTPLDRRSRRLRGDKLLLVSPPDDVLSPATGTRAHTRLDRQHATKERLADALRRHRRGQVRIDSHGYYEDGDATESWLELAPKGPAGRLSAKELQSMDLRGCGTLMLGACESGMAQPAGRDERIGFVRAALYAGAASVVAARWVAAETASATILDRFGAYLRYLPRDIALQRAQCDVYHGAPGVPPDAMLDHPAYWACWTLYGDSGRQTRADPLRRLLRHRLDQRRKSHARG